MPSLALSVIICTHNPDARRLERTLEALAAQTLARDRWELIIIDNASSPAVSQRVSFPANLPPVRMIVESELGLTPARLAGIAAAHADNLVFVDDDNVLAANYLEAASRLLESEPTIGAAGGIITGEYETPPPRWILPHIDLLGIRDFGARPIRSLVYNMVGPWEPIGAGMVIRKSIAEHYAHVARDPLRRSLDRRGSSLGSCGDTDMARCAPELGFYLAYEPSLRLTHLIPAFRLRFVYMMRMRRALKRTGILLDRVRTGLPAEQPRAWRAWPRLPLEAARQFTPSIRNWLLRIASIVGEIEARRIKIERRAEQARQA
jgi:glycosyltransferase involved in cell wall biosynthesis